MQWLEILDVRAGTRGLGSDRPASEMKLCYVDRNCQASIGKRGRRSPTEVRDWHRLWLGDVYAWAGHYRRVNISKDGFPFAAATQVPTLMNQFDREVLGRWTPCSFSDQREVVCALAETHVELVLIHPFREGNGRLGQGLCSNGTGVWTDY